MEWGDLFRSILILFAVVNPIGSVPLFLQITGKLSLKEREQAFRTGVIAAAIILFAFAIAGDRILTHFFQIEISHLMAAGGLLLLIIAIDHLVFGSLVKGVLSEDQQDASHIGAVPIACPVLAGPGAMMTVLVTFSEHGFWIAALSIAVVIGVTWFVLRFIDTIYRVLGKTVCTVLNKILCLFIAAIGIRLLMQGLSLLLK